MDKEMINRIKGHIDFHCGNSPEDYFKEHGTDLSVAKFVNVPDNNFVTHLSLGLASHVLKQKKSGSKVRQELLICIKPEYEKLPWQDIIFSVGSLMMRDHNALMRGQVLGPRGLLFPERPKIKMTSLLCSYPAFFREEFCQVEQMDIPTFFVELIPITTAESKFISEKGWSKFFDRIDNGEVDILNLERE